MEKIKVLLRELTNDFQFVENRELLLPVMPHKDDKIDLDINGIGYVFHVVEIHIAEQGVDI